MIYQGNQSDYDKWVAMMGQKLGTTANSTSSGSSSSGYSGGNYGSVPTAPEIDPYVAPAPYVAPTYEAPVYDEEKVSGLTQSTAAPAIRGLRSSMQKVMNKSNSNPNVQRMTLREALAGYGQGLQSAVSEASTTARNLYNTQYGIEADTKKANYNANVDAAKTNYQTSVDTAKTNYQTNANSKMASYNAALQSYMASTYGTGATRYGSDSNQYSATASSASTPTRVRMDAAGTIPYNSSGAKNNKGQWLDYDGTVITE
jgi:hypothetical protein